MIKIRLLILFISFSSVATPALAQGCSDAGFCSAGALQPGLPAHDSTKMANEYGGSLTYGSGENGTSVITLQAEAKINTSAKGFIEARLPFTFVSGNLGAHSGVGDPIVTYSHLISAPQSVHPITATIGTRIGIGNADAKDKGVLLPMPYQSGLGTTDLIVGLGMKFARYFSFAAGYQQPLFQYNNNGYLPDTVYPVMKNDHRYFASRDLVRKGDVLIRAEANYSWKKFSASLGPLLIYHLGKDRYTDAAGNDATLTGSEGITLNIAGSISCNSNVGMFTLLFGMPVVVRDYRPDGLTRAAVFTLRYTWRR